MKLSIEHKGNHQHAKIPGRSYRIDGKVHKTGVVYLGRVIDLDKGVFCNKERHTISTQESTELPIHSIPKGAILISGRRGNLRSEKATNTGSPLWIEMASTSVA